MTEEEFRMRMAELAKDDPPIRMTQLDSLIDTLSPWESNQIAIHLHARDERPRHFLKWSTIQKTMFVGNAPYVELEWEELRLWARWKNTLNTPYFGRPVISNIKDEYNSQLCGNTIHQAFMLNSFEQESRTFVSDFDSIFEFGAGYGALCYLIHKLGFMGKYQIYDLPEMALIQEYYLSNTIGGGINVDWMKTFDVFNNEKVDLFIANISISEVDIELRDKIFYIFDAEHYFITYLPTHNKVNNLSNINYLFFS